MSRTTHTCATLRVSDLRALCSVRVVTGEDATESLVGLRCSLNLKVFSLIFSLNSKLISYSEFYCIDSDLDEMKRAFFSPVTATLCHLRVHRAAEEQPVHLIQYMVC